MSEAGVEKLSTDRPGAGRRVARSVRQGMGIGLGLLRRIILYGRQSFPKQVGNILVVCKGNICRSPLAEAYLKERLDTRGIAAKVESAGLETSLGKPAHPLAQLVGSQHGLSLTSHATTPLHKDQVERASLILVMEWRQRRRLVRLYPNAAGKVFLLRQFYDHSVEEVADPYSGTVEDFQRCLAMVKVACDTLVARIETNQPSQNANEEGTGRLTCGETERGMLNKGRR